MPCVTVITSNHIHYLRKSSLCLACVMVAIEWSSVRLTFEVEAIKI